MKSHACPNHLGNHTCKSLPITIPVEVSFPFLDSFLLFLCFPCFPYSFLQTRVIQENFKWPRVRARENNERDWKSNWDWAKGFLTNPQNFFLLMRPPISSFSIIFFQFSPYMKLVTFHLSFLLISFISYINVPNFLFSI